MVLTSTLYKFLAYGAMYNPGSFMDESCPPITHHSSLTIGPHSLLSLSSLSCKSSCQLHAALFLTHVYVNWTHVHASELDDDDTTDGGVLVQESGAPSNFDATAALLTCLCGQDKSKATNIQMVR